MDLLIKLGLLFLATALSGCHQHELIGSKRDLRGCIPSAGYVWDSERNECLRPWEMSPVLNESKLKNQ